MVFDRNTVFALTEKSQKGQEPEQRISMHPKAGHIDLHSPSATLAQSSIP